MKSGSKKQNDNSCANCRVYLFDYGLKQPYCSECYEEAKAQPQYKETAECLAEELMLQQRKLAAAEKKLKDYAGVHGEYEKELKKAIMAEDKLEAVRKVAEGTEYYSNPLAKIRSILRGGRIDKIIGDRRCGTGSLKPAVPPSMRGSRLPASVEGVSDSPPCSPPPRKQKREASR